MKSAIFTFILLSLLSLSAFAQGETKKTEAYKVDEIGAAGDCDVNVRVQMFSQEIGANPNSKAVFIVYKGFVKDKPYYSNNSQIFFLRRNIDIFQFDKDKTIIQEAGFREKYTVEFWIVPEGAEMPKPTNVAEKVDELGKANDGDFKNHFYNSYNELSEDSKLYLINTGTKKDKKARLRQIDKVLMLYSQMIDRKRIIIIDGGYSKELKTEFWILKK